MERIWDIQSDEWFFDGLVSSKWWHWMIHDYTLHICEFFQCQDPPKPARVLSIHLVDRSPSQYDLDISRLNLKPLLQINIVLYMCIISYQEVVKYFKNSTTIDSWPTLTYIILFRWSSTGYAEKTNAQNRRGRERAGKVSRWPFLAWPTFLT